MAPAWFGPALAQGLAVALAPINQELTALRTDVTTLRADVNMLLAKSNNISAIKDDDSIDPPSNGVVEPGQDFPRTIGALKALSPQTPDQLLRRLEDYYGLPHNGSPEVRRRRLMRVYGVKPLVEYVIKSF